ncbi:MAG: hypothetical protein NVS1B12_01690 [Acidimicrobiales bacterium]
MQLIPAKTTIPSPPRRPVGSSPTLRRLAASLAGIGLVAITVLAVAGVGPAAGDDQSRLNQLRAREQQIKVQLNLAVASDTAVQAEAVRLQRQVATEQALVTSARSAVAAAQQRVDEATQRINDLIARGNAAHMALVNRAIDLYEHPYRGEELLLNGVHSLDELTTRQVLSNAVQAKTSDLLDAVRQQQAQEVAARKELTSAHQDADRRRQAAEAEQGRLDTALASAETAHSALQGRIHDLQVENAGLAAQEAPLQAKLAAATAQYAAQIAAAQAAAQASARASTAGAGSAPSGAVGSYGLQWPLSGPVTREFGNQPGGFHPGIDIAPGYGSPIYAAGDGVVIYAGWESGYGNYTCIDHGRNISSCYGHQSELDVSVGETVHRGQFIGREGSTGNSTGPHVHFEIRVGGSVNNPRDFIPGSP